MVRRVLEAECRYYYEQLTISVQASESMEMASRKWSGDVHVWRVMWSLRSVGFDWWSEDLADLNCDELMTSGRVTCHWVVTTYVR